MQCAKHAKNFMMVCADCQDSLVCLQCISADHKGHTFLGLEEYPDKIREKIEAAKVENAKIVLHLQRVLCEIKSKRKLQSGTSKPNIRSAILKRGQQLHDIVKRLIQQLLTAYEKHSQLERANDNKDVSVQAALDKAKNVSYKLNQILQTDDLSGVSDVIPMLETPYSDMTNLAEPALFFSPGKEDIGQLMGMLGTLGGSGIAPSDLICEIDEGEVLDIHSPRRSPTGSPRSPDSTISTKLKADFRTFGSRAVNVIRAAGPGLCWINFIRESWLWITDGLGNTKRRMSMDYAVKSLTVTKQGVLVVLSGDQNVYKISSDYKISKFFRTPHLFPRDICAMPDETLLLTLVESEKLTITPSSQRIVSRYTSTGQRIITVERDSNMKRLFVWPFCVRTNNSGTLVAVVNKTAEDASHIVILDENLNLVQRYIGEGIVVRDDEPFNRDILCAKFHPMDVVFDKNNNFIIAEFFTKTIQFLSSSCTRLVTIATFLHIPRSLVFHGNEDIWVGLEDGSVQILSLK